MALTKSDLFAIREVVQDELKPLKSDISILKRDVKKLDKKFIKLFNFLDKELLKIKTKVKELYSHLRLSTSDF